MATPYNFQIEKGKTWAAELPYQELDGYGVVFRYGGEGELQTADCSYDGKAYEVTLPVSKTSELVVGDYRCDFTARKVDGDGVVTEAHTLWRGRAQVVNFVDPQFDKQWLYDALEKAQAALADYSDGVDTSISLPDGTTGTFETRSDLLSYIAQLERTLARHERDAMYGEMPAWVDLGLLRNA